MLIGYWKHGEIHFQGACLGLLHAPFVVCPVPFTSLSAVPKSSAVILHRKLDVRLVSFS